MISDFDANEAQKTAEEDFASDAAGGDTLSREQFMDAIYEYRRGNLTWACFTSS